MSRTPMQAVTSGANPVSIKRGIDKTCAHLVARLGDLSRDVKGTEDIRVHSQNLIPNPWPAEGVRGAPQSS